MDLRNIEDRLAELGQRHIVAHLKRLSESARERFLARLDIDDVALVLRLHSELVLSGGTVSRLPDLEEMSVPEIIPLPEGAPESLRSTGFWKAGEEALRKGTVACLMVAGGQGSRLGFPGPKGAFPIGPVTDRSLFQIQAQKVLAASRRYGRPVPFYIMVSPRNEEATRRFFEERNFFGLPEKDVFFFTQKMLPSVDETGKILLENEETLFLSPNGHGGVLEALRTSGALDDMRRRGIETVSYFQVDNPLVRAVDPHFIGVHLDRSSEMSLKVLRKREPLEKVGNLVLHKGKARVIEYSDLPEELAVAEAPDGGPLFRFGSIAIHAFHVDFLERVSEMGLPFHAAHKKIPFLAPDGSRVEPPHPNGYKFETFIFDALPRAERFAVVETSRDFEFSPVKNASGRASPETSRRDISRFYAASLRKAGVPLPEEAASWSLELSPLCGLDAVELGVWLAAMHPGLRPADGLVLEPEPSPEQKRRS